MSRNPPPRPDDHLDDMDRTPVLDDVTSERLVIGSGDVPLSLHPLAEALAALRQHGDEPPPEPSAALAAALADPSSVVERVEPAVAVPAGRRLRHRIGWVGATAAGLLLSAGAAGALPAPAQDVIAWIVEAVTPFDLPNGRERGADTSQPVAPIVVDEPRSRPSSPSSPSPSPSPSPSEVAPSPTPPPASDDGDGAAQDEHAPRIVPDEPEPQPRDEAPLDEEDDEDLDSDDTDDAEDDDDAADDDERDAEDEEDTADDESDDDER